MAAGVDEIPRAVFGAPSAGRRGWAPAPLWSPSQLSFGSRCAGRGARGVARALTLAAAQPRRPSALAAGVAGGLACRRAVRRAALVARLARRGLAVQGSAAGAGRIAGYVHHGCRHRTIRGARVSSGGVAAGRAAREAVRPRNSTPCSRTSANTSRGTTISRRILHQLVEIAVLVSSAGVVHRPAACSKNASAPATRRCSRAATTRREYAAGILAVCRHCAAVHSAHAVAALAGDLTQRIRHILSGASPVSLGFIKAFVLSIGTLLRRRRAAVRRRRRRRRAPPADGGMPMPAPCGMRDVRGDTRATAMVATHARLSPPATSVTIRNSSLRELVALAYGVESRQVTGAGEWFDATRYDIRARLAEACASRRPSSRRVARLRSTATGVALRPRDLRQPAVPVSLRARALETSDATRLELPCWRPSPITCGNRCCSAHSRCIAREPGTQQSRHRAPVAVAHLRVEIPGAASRWCSRSGSGWVSRWFTAPIRFLNGWCAARLRSRRGSRRPSRRILPRIGLVALLLAGLAAAWLCFRLVTGAVRVEFERGRSGSLAAGRGRRRCASGAGILQGGAVHFLRNLVLRRRAAGRRNFRRKLAARAADRKRRAHCVMRRWP